ncbi:hypothetical protein M3M33_13565, partial [Loigolactobacillus coryniformis]|uniref:hypothetical protein n=1 Tax=Loigolactobacillus coryniformis TaxID=1610 RepID=UPI00201B1069
AYAKWSRVKDTPWTPQQSENETAGNDPQAPNVTFPPAPAPSPSPPDAPKSQGPASDAPKGFWARFFASLTHRMKG